MSRGGARPGSGRKPKPNYAKEIKGLNEQASETLKNSFENLIKLANGEAVTVVETWAPACTLVRKSGDQLVPLHPTAHPEKMVMVKRQVIHEPPNRYANEYLVNRLMGRPQVQAELEGRAPEEVKERREFTPSQPGEYNAYNHLRNVLWGQEESNECPSGDEDSFLVREWRKRRYEMCKLFAPDTPFTGEEIARFESEIARHRTLCGYPEPTNEANQSRSHTLTSFGCRSGSAGTVETNSTRAEYGSEPQDAEPTTTQTTILPLSVQGEEVRSSGGGGFGVTSQAQTDIPTDPPTRTEFPPGEHWPPRKPTHTQIIRNWGIEPEPRTYDDSIPRFRTSYADEEVFFLENPEPTPEDYD